MTSRVVFKVRKSSGPTGIVGSNHNAQYLSSNRLVFALALDGVAPGAQNMRPRNQLCWRSLLLDRTC